MTPRQAVLATWACRIAALFVWLLIVTLTVRYFTTDKWWEGYAFGFIAYPIVNGFKFTPKTGTY